MQFFYLHDKLISEGTHLDEGVMHFYPKTTVSLRIRISEISEISESDGKSI